MLRRRCTLQMDALPSTFRINISSPVATLRLPKGYAKLGEKVMDGAEVVGIKPVLPEKPVDIKMPEFMLTFDTEKGIDLTIPEGKLLDCPPLLIKVKDGDSDIGILATRIKLDMSSTTGIPEVLMRPGFDESWKGVYIGELEIYGLNQLLPLLPASFKATNWICGTTDGWSGSLDVSEFPIVDEKSIWKVWSLGSELDHGNVVRGTIAVTMRVGSLSSELRQPLTRGRSRVSLHGAIQPGILRLRRMGF